MNWSFPKEHSLCPHIWGHLILPSQFVLLSTRKPVLTLLEASGKLLAGNFLTVCTSTGKYDFLSLVPFCIVWRFFCVTFVYSSASPKLTANVGQTSLKLGQFLPFSAGTFCSCPGKVTSNQTRRESTEMFSFFLQLKWKLPSADIIIVIAAQCILMRSLRKP